MLPPIAPAICASSVRSRPLGGEPASGDLAIDPGIRVAGHRHLPEPPRCQRARGLAVRHDRLLLAPRTNDVGDCKQGSASGATRAPGSASSTTRAAAGRPRPARRPSAARSRRPWPRSPPPARRWWSSVRCRRSAWRSRRCWRRRRGAGGTSTLGRPRPASPRATGSSSRSWPTWRRAGWRGSFAPTARCVQEPGAGSRTAGSRSTPTTTTSRCTAPPSSGRSWAPPWRRSPPPPSRASAAAPWTGAAASVKRTVKSVHYRGMAPVSEGKYGFETLAIHAGASPDPTTGARAVPIYQTTSYVFDDVDHAAALFNLQKFGNIYSRLTNPTVSVLEERVAALEGGTAACATASGHAAQFLTFLALMSAGDDIVASSKLYGGSISQMRQSFPQLGWKANFVDPCDPANFA